MRRKFKKEVELFYTALGFFTRIPIPKRISFSQNNFNRCNRYFPHIGLITGSVAVLVYWGTSFILPPSIAVLLSMVSSIIFTGAFHEDGFADVCDGFGGGWSKEQILTIMKDSRIGAYGSIGILFLLGIKFFALFHLSPSNLILSSLKPATISLVLSVEPSSITISSKFL